MNRIRSLREEIGMSQKELADRLGLTGSGVVSKYETGRLGLSEDTLRKMAEIFGVSVDYILGISDVREWGTSLSRPPLNWNALALVESADALSEDERRALLSCARQPDALALVRQYTQLSNKSKRRVSEYLSMLKLSEDARATDRGDQSE